MGDGPKSFKNMMFPPPRDGAITATYAPIKITPPSKTISQQEAERRSKLLKEMKAFINSERCPLCDAQLDGSVTFEGANVFCRAFTEKEYKAEYKYGVKTPIYSVATHYTSSAGYQIVSSYLDNGNYHNALFKLDLTLNERFQQLEKKEILSFEGKLFAFPKGLSEKDLEKKIHLYRVFS